mmetsp:Transcript_1673/g.6952  ORF Transcript_1673/g.6952 Transcript_1673/m.6952 type:complete len:348 (-) Transcript_1673:37-1080(-)
MHHTTKKSVEAKPELGRRAAVLPAPVRQSAPRTEHELCLGLHLRPAAGEPAPAPLQPDHALDPVPVVRSLILHHLGPRLFGHRVTRGLEHHDLGRVGERLESHRTHVPRSANLLAFPDLGPLHRQQVLQSQLLERRGALGVGVGLLRLPLRGRGLGREPERLHGLHALLVILGRGDVCGGGDARVGRARRGGRPGGCAVVDEPAFIFQLELLQLREPLGLLLGGRLLRVPGLLPLPRLHLPRDVLLLVEEALEDVLAVVQDTLRGHHRIQSVLQTQTARVEVLHGLLAEPLLHGAEPESLLLVVGEVLGPHRPGVLAVAGSGTHGCRSMDRGERRIRVYYSPSRSAA